MQVETLSDLIHNLEIESFELMDSKNIIEQSKGDGMKTVLDSIIEYCQQIQISKSI